MAAGSSTCAGGVEGGSDASEPGKGERGCGRGDVAATLDRADARRVEFPEAEEVVESSGSSTTSQVCKVASGANDTLRFASDDQREVGHTGSFVTETKVENAPKDLRLASLRAFSLSRRSRSTAAFCCSSSVRTATKVCGCDKELRSAAPLRLKDDPLKGFGNAMSEEVAPLMPSDVSISIPSCVPLRWLSGVRLRGDLIGDGGCLRGDCGRRRAFG